MSIQPTNNLKVISYNSTGFNSQRADFICDIVELEQNIVHAGVLHRGDNVSGHSPVFLDLITDCLPKRQIPEVKKPAKQNWREATENDKAGYRTKLDDALQGINPIEECLACENLSCDSVRHKDDLDNYIIEIIEAIETTTKDSIPYRNAPQESQYKASKRKHIPGWREHVKPFKEEAHFWYVEWRAIGKPRSGFLYDNMRFFRNKFKYSKRMISGHDLSSLHYLALQERRS